MSHTRVVAATCSAAILAPTHSALPTTHGKKPTPTPPPPPPPPTGRPPGLIQAGNSKTTCISGEPDALPSLLVTTGITYNCFLTYANADPAWVDWVSPWNTRPGSLGGFPAWVNADPTRHQMIETMNLAPDATIIADPNWAQDCAANVSGTTAFPSSISTYATQLATTMVARGFGYTVMSFGAEMNGTWNRDSIGNTVAAQQAWAQCYANIVTAMRSVPGANFLFEWAVNANYRNIPLANYYPGNAYVDLIGIDAYDASGVTLPPVGDPTRFAALAAEPLGLNAVRDFAVAQGRPLSIPEWGLMTPTASNNGGGDDPAYVTAMANFVKSNDMAFQSFFNSGDAGTLALGSTAPLATAAYVNAFGS
jgi:Glycosyl hydrolase family 26